MLSKAWLSMTLCVLFCATPARAQDTTTPGGAPATAANPAASSVPQNLAVPQPEVLLALLRTSLIGLDQANKTNNYTVLRDFGGPGMRRFSNSELASLFTNLRNSHFDLAVVSILSPEITQTPAVTKDGLLTLVGYFPSRPLQIQFQIVFQPFEGQWRLFGLSVNVSKVAAEAPVAAVAPPEAPAEAVPAAPAKLVKAKKKSKTAVEAAPPADTPAPDPAAAQ